MGTQTTNSLKNSPTFNFQHLHSFKIDVNWDNWDFTKDIIVSIHLGQIALDGYFSKKRSLFCNFDSCFQALFALVWLLKLFPRVNHMFQSRFWTRHLRSGTWKVPLNMDNFEVFSHLSLFVYQFVCFRIDLKPSYN